MSLICPSTHILKGNELLSRYNFPTRKIRSKTTLIVTAVVILIYLAMTVYTDYKNFAKAREAMSVTDGLFSAHFIDVGQGDATLICSPGGEHMLIDCGTTDSSEYLVKYLKDMGVDSLEYLIITHPHEDHYGGAPAVIDTFPVENFMIHEDFAEIYPYDIYIDELSDNEDTEIIYAEVKDKFEFADCAAFMILSPKEADYDDYNNSSMSLKLVFGSTSFLFTGDAESRLEKEMLSGGYNLDSDVFQAGHHGSSTSNKKSFVNAVSPEYAVISCGEDNRYGHPHKESLEVFEKCGAEILRTDEMSDIVLLSDGTAVGFAENFSNSNNEKKEPQSKNMIGEYIKNLMERLAA